MPRRRRPTPPLPGSIPTRNIAPKPDSSSRQTSADDLSGKTTAQTPSTSRQSNAGSDIESGSCGVPQCTIAKCQLPTHLNYGRQRRLALLHSRIAEEKSSRSPPSQTAETSFVPNIQLDPDAMVNLPISDSTNPEFQRLFTQFFQHHFDRLVLIYRPQRRDPAFKQVVYRLALHSPVYCLTLIAQAHMGNIKDRTSSFDQQADRLTDLIYSKLLQLTRERVESFDIGDVDVLLLAIVALCEYDLKLNRYDALCSHHIGMTALVSKCGGVHNLGLSLPYVLRMDRFLAVRANLLPQFASPELPSTSIILRQSPEYLVYGSTLKGKTSSLSEKVRSYCSDAAQLLDLMVELQITFDPAKVSDTFNPKTEYFYFLRENLDVRHAILNHQHSVSASSVNKDLLALTATKIVIYYTAYGNYLSIVTGLLATRLWNMLTKTPMPSPSGGLPTLERSSSDATHVPTIDLSDWSNDMPMLLWLLFACALPNSREGSLSFAGHLTSASLSSTAVPTIPSSRSSKSPVKSRTPSHSSSNRTGQAIVSPSSPRRHRYLPSFVLHVAEHLVGERPLSGTAEWEDKIKAILEGFVWSDEWLSEDFERIVARLHENVLAGVDEDA